MSVKDGLEVFLSIWGCGAAVDTADLKSAAHLGSLGSNPTFPTILFNLLFRWKVLKIV